MPKPIRTNKHYVTMYGGTFCLEGDFYEGIYPKITSNHDDPQFGDPGEPYEIEIKDSYFVVRDVLYQLPDAITERLFRTEPAAVARAIWGII